MTKQQERTLWSQQWLTCMACGVGMATDTHEIVRRSQSVRWQHTANYLRLCRNCHSERFANVTRAPYAAQLALKKLRDPEHYDYEAFVEILGRSRTAVTPEEVELCVRAMQLIGEGQMEMPNAVPK